MSSGPGRAARRRVDDRVLNGNQSFGPGCANREGRSVR